MSVSKRAEGFWKRMRQWYGQRIVDAYGEEPPPDWAKIIDMADNTQIKAALEKIRSVCPIHPPTFPQFEIAIKNVTALPVSNKDDVVNQLCEFILRRHHQGITPLTDYQIAGIPRWIAISKEFDAPDMTGAVKRNHGVEFIGMIVPADGDSKGYRVMVEDMRFD